MNYIRTVWRGDESLVAVFWVWLIGFQMLLFELIYLPFYFHSARRLEPIIAFILIEIVVIPWSFVGIWRSSCKARRTWKWLSRAVAILISFVVLPPCTLLITAEIISAEIPHMPWYAKAIACDKEFGSLKIAATSVEREQKRREFINYCVAKRESLEHLALSPPTIISVPHH